MVNTDKSCEISVDSDHMGESFQDIVNSGF